MSGRFRLVVAAALAAAVCGGGAIAGVRLSRALPLPSVAVAAPASLVPAPGEPPAVALPPQGSLALEDGEGSLARLDADQVRAIGSVAKAMTALQVLRAHPLAPGDDGPVLTMTAADVDDLQAALAAGGSAVAVTAGEHISERQLLLGLLLPSANNFAETLGRWVAGSHDAFVSHLNAAALSLGMTHTHFTDPSGYSPQTVSTASDLVLLGRAVLADQRLAELVATQTATMPDGTVVHNLDALLATRSDWLGIKTGETPSAGGCLLFAARRAPQAGGQAVTVVGAVLGQADLAGALHAAGSAVDSAFAGYAEVGAAAVVPAVRGAVTVPWSDGVGVRVEPVADATATVRRGVVVSLRVTTAAVAVPVPAGTEVGAVEAVLGGRTVLRWAVRAVGAVEAPSWTWRLLDG